MNTNLVQGSLGQIANRDNISLADAFLNADEIVLVDTSGSMKTNDSTGGLSRYNVACTELVRLQHDLPGKIALFSFSDECLFCPSGIPVLLGGGTNLLRAINHVIGADSLVGFTIISDGYPDPGTDHQIIDLASRMQSRINTIFAGPVEDETGRRFMQQLAQVARGKSHLSANAADLSGGMKLLLEKT